MISREEARNELRAVRYEAKRGGLYMPFTSSKRVEALETAIESLSQPERPKGRWELIHDDWNVYQCTECKEWWTLKCATPQENNMNFCPFCGSDNRGEE